MGANRIEVNPGDRYGRLTVIREVESRIMSSGKKARRVQCQCECGNETTVELRKLRERKPACGCQRGGKVKHGLAGTPLYKAWHGMISRCENPLDSSYLDYGGRGITVCHEWHDRDTFIAWAKRNGWRKGLQIDRKDNNRGYSPDNCRFVTAKVNQRNTRLTRMITFNGETRSMSEWAEHLGIDYYTLSTRINTLKWSIERALTQPVREY